MCLFIHRALGVSLLTILILLASVQASAQKIFASPDDAAKALLQSFKSGDLDVLAATFGPDAAPSFASGDPIADRNDRQAIALAMEQSWRWVHRGANEKELIIGDEQWPFPVALAKVAGGWQFDIAAGKEEVLARRVGRNELAVIDLCRTYVHENMRMTHMMASRPESMRKGSGVPLIIRTACIGAQS